MSNEDKPVQQPAAVGNQHYEAGRQQGRAEALAILMELDPESGIDEYTGWSAPVSPEDEGSAYWDEPKLRELFAADGALADMMDKAEGEYWQYKGLQDEAEYAKNFAANMHNSGRVREVLAKAGEYDLMAQLCNTAPVPTAGVQGDVMRALNDARSVAMKNAVDARIPECADFAAIAQNLDWALNNISQPDSGRDAVLEMKKAIIAVISYGHSHSEAPTARFAKELLGAIERDDRVAKALAAHPANGAKADMLAFTEVCVTGT